MKDDLTTTGHMMKSFEAVMGRMIKAGLVAGLARHPDGRFIIFWTKKRLESLETNHRVV
jgi:hypothetical protein